MAQQVIPPGPFNDQNPVIFVRVNVPDVLKFMSNTSHKHLQPELIHLEQIQGLKKV